MARVLLVSFTSSLIGFFIGFIVFVFFHSSLNNWQTLIGSILGAFFAVVGSFGVAMWAFKKESKQRKAKEYQDGLEKKNTYLNMLKYETQLIQNIVRGFQIGAEVYELSEPSYDLVSNPLHKSDYLSMRLFYVVIHIREFNALIRKRNGLDRSSHILLEGLNGGLSHILKFLSDFDTYLRFERELIKSSGHKELLNTMDGKLNAK